MGIEPPALSPENTTSSLSSGANSGAPNLVKPEIDPALASLVAAWPELPAPIQKGILAMVRAAMPDSTKRGI